MYSPNPVAGSVLDRLFEAVVLDFVLAFVFFAALCYAVLGRTFGRDRPAAAMSAALGFALAVGLVWWEQAAGFSMRDLGPVAVAFVLIVLAGVLYAAIRQVGGSWAGAGFGLSACILFGALLGMPWSIAAGFVQFLILIAFFVGAVALVVHLQAQRVQVPPAPIELARVRHDMRDLEATRRTVDDLSRSLAQLRTEADFVIRRPDVAGDFRVQLQRLLPVEGLLTQRLARLRETARYARLGHLARIREIRRMVDKLPPAARVKAQQELAARYEELQLDTRLERLDAAVAQVEGRIRNLTAQAVACVANREFPRVQGLLDEAAKLQEHNARLIRVIERTEQRLLDAARLIARQQSGVAGA